MDADLLGDIISGTIGGIVAGVLLPATLFLFNWIRNRQLEKKIRQGFGLCGCGSDSETVHLRVENHLPIEVRIRAVVLVGRGAGGEGRWEVHLKYLQPLPQTALLNAIGLDKHPVRIIAGAHFPHEVDPEVAVSLFGFTGGAWGVPRETFLKYPWDIESGWIVVEYPTLFGGSAFFRVALDGRTIKGVQDTVAHIRGLVPPLIPL